jgi:hypothetical protein
VNGDPGLRAGILYLAIAGAGIYLLVSGHLGTLVSKLAGGVTGAAAAAAAPLQGPSFLRGTAASVQAHLVAAP